MRACDAVKAVEDGLDELVTDFLFHLRSILSLPRVNSPRPSPPSLRSFQPYEVEALAEKNAYSAIQKEYIEGGGKEKWAASHPPKNDTASPPPPSAAPEPSTAAPSNDLLSVIAAFQQTPGVDGADAIRLAISQLPEAKRHQAAEYFEELVKSKSLKGLEHLLAGETGVVVTVKEDKGKGKEKEEMTENMKKRKAAAAYKKMLVVGCERGELWDVRLLTLFS